MTHLLAIGPFQLILALVTTFLFFIPTIIALVDILRNEFTQNNKIIWLLVVLFTNIIGVILYFIIGRKQKLPRTNGTR